MFSKVCSGAKSSVTGMARRSDVENGYSGWKRAAWLSLGVALTILGLAGLSLSMGVIAWIPMGAISATALKSGIILAIPLGACGVIPLMGGGAILRPAIGYHFKKVTHETFGDKL